MKAKSVKIICSHFKYLEDEGMVDHVEIVDTGVLDIIIIDYHFFNGLVLRIERERGYFNAKIRIREECIDYPYIKENFLGEKYNYNEYYGESGLAILSREVHNGYKKYLEFALSPNSYHRRP